MVDPGTTIREAFRRIDEISMRQVYTQHNIDVDLRNLTLQHQISFSRVPNVHDGPGSYAMIGYTGGRSALRANDFPLSRLTTKTTPSFRHLVKINYFTDKWGEC